MIDLEELNKTVIEIKPIEVQIVENILSKKDLKYKYYDVKKEKNRNNYFCKNCGEKISKWFYNIKKYINSVLSVSQYLGVQKLWIAAFLPYLFCSFKFGLFVI